MLTVGIIVGITIVALIVLVLCKPQVIIKGHAISIYWIAPLLGAVTLCVCGCIDLEQIWHGLTADTSINPIKILVLFLSMTFMSIYLDEVGFFCYLANVVLRKAKTSQKMLFIYLYLVVSILTIFTSNDIIILTFTPFICYFSKSAKINPIPYLFAEFVGANTWSLFLIIGNPTNVFLATSMKIDFVSYASVMTLPTLLGGVVSFTVLYLLFHKQFSQPLTPLYECVLVRDRGAMILGLVHLGLCTLLLAVASYVGLEMWLITCAFALSLIVCTLIMRLCRKNAGLSLLKCIKREPWELLPFVLSMFVMVLSLENTGMTQSLAQLLGKGNTVIRYGVASFISANAINNIPMSVLFSSVISYELEQAQLSALYASIIGSNICAFFTPIGALAGIMWSGIVRGQGVKFTFTHFVKYGALVSIPTLFACLCGLMIVL
ncbi:MAG: ArsB/NhaD family transporter [Clostridia bacterium]|nr:ArsB/NhaD family transporter [Clostridia bacterium]